jgi:hypothetical protein
MGRSIKTEFKLKEKTEENLNSSPQKLCRTVKNTYLNAGSESADIGSIPQQTAISKIFDTGKVEAILVMQRQMPFL